MALHRAGAWLVGEGLVDRNPVRDLVAAVSVGIVDGELRLDLDYPEDSSAQVDMNVVATGKGRFVEVQGTGEEGTFSPLDLTALTDLALAGIRELTRLQREALEDAT